MVAHAQYIASNEAGMAGGAVDAVLDVLLKPSVYADRVGFDFGDPRTEADGMVLNGGVVRNKEERRRARHRSHDFYELDLV